MNGINLPAFTIITSIEIAIYSALNIMSNSDVAIKVIITIFNYMEDDSKQHILVISTILSTASMATQNMDPTWIPYQEQIREIASYPCDQYTLLDQLDDMKKPIHYHTKRRLLQTSFQ